VGVVLLGGENTTDGGFLAAICGALAELAPTLPELADGGVRAAAAGGAGRLYGRLGM
jgi:hypothetical protein